MTARRKLAIFGPLPPPISGMETFTGILLDQLRRNGDVGAWMHFDTSIDDDISHRAHFTVGKGVRLLSQIARSWTIARDHDAYYPISQNRIGLVRDVLLLAPFRVARSRIVLHLHGGDLHRVLPGEPRWLMALLRWLTSGDSTGIALTPSLRECFLPLLPPSRIRVVPNTAVVPQWTTSKPPLDRGLHVLFMSTLIEGKGYRELVDAVRALSKDVDITLELAGEPYADADRRWIRRLPPDQRVRFIGRVEGEQKWEALRRSHVLALPATAPEGQPMSIIEGMAASCAIVATRWAGIVDTVGEREAVLVPPSAGEPLRRALEEVLRGLHAAPERVAELGRAGRARFEAELAPRHFLPAWLAAVNGPRPAPEQPGEPSSNGSPRIPPAALARTLHLDVLAAQLVDAFAQHGIESILLRGPAIAGRLYDDGRVLRRYDDIDLLVARESFPACATLLRSRGFLEHLTMDDFPEPWHADTWSRDSDRVAVDLHHTLLGVRAPSHVTWAELRQHRDSIRLATREVPVLDDSALAFLIALHAAAHGSAQGKWLEDLARALERFGSDTWRSAACIATRLDATASFATGLGLLARGHEVAATIGLLRERSTETAVRASSPPPFAVGLSRLAASSDRREAARFVLRKLFPTRRYMRATSPLAARGRWGLAAAYGARPVILTAGAAPAVRAWLHARRLRPGSPPSSRP